MSTTDPTVSPADEVNPGDFVQSLGNATNIVDVVILGLTIIGAAGVMLNIGKKEWQSGKGSTIRSRLVLFLVFGDLILGIVGIIPAAATIAGNAPVTGTGFCDGVGFLLAVVIWAQHFNTLSLAVCTYLILIAPLSRWTALIERRYMWSLPLVWLCSIVMAAIAWGVQGQWAANAGLCFYQPGLFGVIYQFIPRGIVFTTISILYVRLFVFLRRPDKIRSSTSLQGNSRSSLERVSVGLNSTGSRIRRSTLSAVRTVRGSFSFPTDRKPSVGEPGGQTSRISEGDEGQESALSHRIPTSPGAVEMEEVRGGPRDVTTGDIRQSGVAGVGRTQRESAGEIPPWERLELSFEGGTLDDVPAADPVVGSGWTWGLKKGGAGVFGGVGEGAGSKGMGGNPTPNLSLLRPPLPPPPAQPALKRQSSFATAPTSQQEPALLLPRRNSDLQDVHAQAWADAEGPLDGDREPTVAYNNNLRRGSHVSFVDSRPPSHPPSPAPGFSSNVLQPTTQMTSTFQFPPSPSTPGFSPITESHSATFSPNYSFGRPAPYDAQASTPPSPTTVLRRDSRNPSFSDQPLATFQVTDLSDLKNQDDFRLAPLTPAKDLSSSTRRSSEATGSTSTSHPLSTRRRFGDDEKDRNQGDSEDQLFGTNADGDDGDEDDEQAQWSLEKILEMTQPPTDAGGERTWEPRERGSGSAEGGTGSDGSPQESMAKFMNRKASLLMLSFPLAYIVLFSVSLIRIIYDFCSNTPIPALVAVSRWFVFAQGLADALIYGLIEAKVKRTVRRRTKAGHFSTSPTDSHSRNNSQALVGGAQTATQERKDSAGTKLSMPRSSRTTA